MLKSTVSRAALLLALSFPGIAHAADAAADGTPASTAPAAADLAADAEFGAEITVTARHREESVQSVPVAISVLNEASFEKSGNYSLNQIQQQVPSLQVVSTNPRNSNLNIRGLGANSSIAVDGLEYGVGFYLDGVYYARPGQSQFDLVDLQQIEVLRGPQGTLFGKNTTSGAINVSSKLPSFSPELTAEANLGNYNYHQIRVSASGPIIADKLAVRLTVADTHRDGFLTNLFDNSKAEDYDNTSVRGQLLWTPSPDLKVRLIGDYSKQKQNYILTLLDGTFSTFANGATIGNNILQRAARLNYTLPAYGAFARLGNSNSHYQANMESYGVSGEIDYDAGPLTLTSITAYRWWDWYPANDTDSLPLSINLKGQQVNFQRQFSQELRVASNGRHFIDYQAGLYYFWQTVRGYGQTQYGSDYAAYNLNPAAPTYSPTVLANTALALTNFEADSYSEPQTKSYAAFGQIDAHLTDQLTLTAGLRFTHEDKKGVFSRFQIPSGLDLTGLDAATITAITTIRNAAANQVSNVSFSMADKSDALSGLATLGYQVTPDVLLYGTYSRGNKSGGLNVTAGGILNKVVRPEKVDNFEIGFKSQFLNRTVTLNAAAFLTNVSDYQANISVPAAEGSTTFIQYIANIPKVRSKGVEADIAWSPSQWVSFGASFAYTDAKYVTYVNAPNAPENNPNVNPVQNLSGVALPGVSKYAYTLFGDLSHPAGDNFEAYVHADWLHRSSFNSSATNSIYALVPAYGLLNGRVGLRTADGKYDFSFWARNLTNKNYYITRGGSNFGLITAAVGDPRTFGATLRAKF